MKRLMSVAVIALLTLATLTSASSAAVKDPRTIEVFYERDLVLLKGYPTTSEVLIEVFRGETLIGSVTGQPADSAVEGPGTLEINHTGEGDCWDEPNTPDIGPGDEVRTTIVNDANDQDSTFVRNVSINFDATVFDLGSGTAPNATDASITLSGVAASTATAPIANADVLELRLNKVNRANTWAANNRRDLREEILRSEIVDGNFTHTFAGLTQEDVRDARDNGVDQILEWSLPSASQELTVFDESEGVPPGCPPLGDGVPEPTPSLSVDNKGLREGNVGTKVMQFTVTRSGPAGSLNSPSTVTVRTANGNFATGNATVRNNDYEAVASRVLSFAAGQSTKTVNVTINGDVRLEPAEKFRVLLSSPTNALLADGLGIGTIRNDDV